MSENDLWLAFDIGTTGTKAAVLDGNGALVASAYSDYPTHSADGGVMEQDAGDWWRATVATARELAPAIDQTRLTGIAVTGQMQDVILLDGDGLPVRPVLLYSDTRARAEVDAIHAQIDRDELKRITGNELDAGIPLAKLLWLKRYEAEALAGPDKRLLFGAADAVVFGLTGIAATDTTTASTTGLMDIGARSLWSASILARAGLGMIAALLPALQPGGTKIGPLTARAAEALGLAPGVPVHLGPGDAGAVTIGIGAGEPGRVYGYLGTSGWIAFTANEPAQAEGVFTLAHPQASRTIQVAPLLTAGGNLEWVRDLFGSDDYASLIAAALEHEPTPVLYLPYLNGERAPFHDPLARGAFIGLTARTDKAALYRAVLEGVVYAYRHARDALTREPVSALTLAGGGTKSRAWCQLFADILDTPVDVAAEADLAGVRGAVLAAQVARGEIERYAPEGRFPVSERLQPDPRLRAHYDRQYAIFRDGYPALRAIFAAMAAS